VLAIGTSEVHRVLSDAVMVFETVEWTYLSHGSGESWCPTSSFLTLGDQHGSRAIALPACVDDELGRIIGVKWVTSFPDNRRTGRPRAQALVILNDAQTGSPLAIMDAAEINLLRTVASAHLVQSKLQDLEICSSGRLGVIGAGRIARSYADFRGRMGVGPERISVYDSSQAAAECFRDEMRDCRLDVTVAGSCAEVIRGADVVLFATTAPSPHVFDPALFHAGQLVLHLSLRDLSPEVIVRANNVTDDRQQAESHGTSLDLTARNGESAIDGTVFELLTDTLKLVPERPTIFSPFGLGVLDLALAARVYRTVRAGKPGSIDLGSTGPIGLGLS